MRAKFCIHGDPQGKGRPRFSTVCGHVHTRTPDETVLYENLVKTEYRQQVGVKFPDDAMLDVRIFAYYPIPKSASKRKRQAMLEKKIRPTKKPDWDNVGKVICDSLNGIMSLNGDTFNALKCDFDQMLRKLLSGMEKFECEEATLNIKVGVKLEKDQARDFEVHEYEAMRDIVKPTFKHEISSAMQVKDKKTGSLSGNYELVWDKSSGQYVMRNIDDGQVTLFDNEGSNVIQMPEPRALPAGDVVDAEYRMLGEGGEEEATGEKDVSEGAPEHPDSPFEYLRQYVGAEMVVLGTKGGIFTLRSGGKVILSSGFSATDRFYCSAEKLAPHVEHYIICEERDGQIIIRCDECDETLFVVDADDGDESGDYPYEEPGEEAEE